MVADFSVGLQAFALKNPERNNIINELRLAARELRFHLMNRLDGRELPEGI